MGLSAGLVSSSDLRDTINFVTRGGYGKATGGTSSSISVGGKNYTLLTFTTDGTLTVTTAGVFDVLLVGAGGGGGGAAGNVVGNIAMGGGGGGQVIQSKIWLDATTYSVDVGAGGAGGQRHDTGVSFGGTAGKLSSIGTVIFAGGGDGCPGGQVGGGANRMMGTGGSAAGSQYGEPQNKPTPLIGANLGGTTGANTNAGGGGGAGTGGSAGNGGVAGKTSGAGNNAVNYGAGGGGTYSTVELFPSGGSGAAGAVYVRFL